MSSEEYITYLEREVERLRQGGCARDQTTTQYCAEAADLTVKNKELEFANRAAQEEIKMLKLKHLLGA